LLVAGRRIRIGESAGQVHEVEIEWLRFDPKGIVLKLRGIDSREAAARLTHQRWYEPREGLPEPEDDEIYVVDLLGLRAVTVEGEVLGKIVDVVEIGPHDVLVIRGLGRQQLVPNVEAFVQRMDFEAGEVIITPIEGLLDDGSGS